MTPHILFVSPQFPPSRGGASTYYSCLVEELAGYIDKIFLLTTFKGGASICTRKGNLFVFRMLLPTLGSQLTFGKRIYLALAFFLSFVISLILILTMRIDLVQSHSITQYAGGIFAARLLRKPTLVDLQDLGSRPTILRKASYVIASSVKTRNFAVSSGCRTIIIPLPLRSLSCPSMSKQKLVLRKYGIVDPFVCYVGDLVRYKGVYELVDAFKALQTDVRFQNYVLVLIGENKEGARFLNVLKTLKSKGKYLGALPHDEVLAMICASEMLVLPSETESLPWVCLEAMSLGKKVILPPNVPEFQMFCSQYVLDRVESAHIADKMKFVLTLVEGPKYPLEKHQVSENILQRITLYEKALGRSKRD